MILIFEFCFFVLIILFLEYIAWVHRDASRVRGFLRRYAGHWAGFEWSWGDVPGEAIRHTAVLASWHHPDSHNWRWCLLWHRPAAMIKFSFWSIRSGPKTYTAILGLHWLGSLELQMLPHTWRSAQPQGWEDKIGKAN